LVLCVVFLNWSVKKSATVFLLSIIPFGTLWYDKKIDQE
jgi:hypothetical protein